MKKRKYTRVASVLLTLVLLASALAGCSSTENCIPDSKIEGCEIFVKK